jgi:DNA-binding transcriptional ArsR family regulator
MTGLSRDEHLVLRAVYELRRDPRYVNAAIDADMVRDSTGLDSDSVEELLVMLDESGHVTSFDIALAGPPIVSGLSAEGLREARRLPPLEVLRGVADDERAAGEPVADEPPAMRRTTGRPTWAPRDLPVLVAAVEGLDQAGAVPWVHSRHIARDLEMEQPVVDAALMALARTGYLELRQDSEGIDVVGATRDAYEKAGLHPSPEMLAERLLAELGRLSKTTEDPEVREQVQRVHSTFSQLGMDFVSNLIWHVLTNPK